MSCVTHVRHLILTTLLITLKLLTNKLGEFQNNSLINSGAKVMFFKQSAIFDCVNFDELQDFGDEMRY